MAAVTIQHLPSEVLMRVFFYLPMQDLVRNAACVCVDWHSYSEDEPLWKQLCLSRWGYLEQIEALRRSSQYVSWYSYFKTNFNRKQLSFLIVGSEKEEERLLDVKTKLISNGIANVDIFNCLPDDSVHDFVSPSLNDLKKYHAVMFFSYHGFQRKDVGDVLADFVDLGGGVVVCSYTNCGLGNRLEGRWLAGRYAPFKDGHTSRHASLMMGDATEHPVLKGVSSFDGGAYSSHGDGSAQPESKVIAKWSNGRPLIAELPKHKGTVLGLNMYPPSSDCTEGGWDSSTQGGLLLANALHYVATTC